MEKVMSMLAAWLAFNPFSALDVNSRLSKLLPGAIDAHSRPNVTVFVSTRFKSKQHEILSIFIQRVRYTPYQAETYSCQKVHINDMSSSEFKKSKKKKLI
jgi:hypothetical protein